jgi:uncharacterized protein
MNRFFDTSSLAKRYTNEHGSAWVRTITLPQPDVFIYITEVTPVEMASALTRKQRNGDISQQAFTLAIDLFKNHLSTQYQTIELNRPILDEAFQLVLRHGLRAYDGIQLAAAQH